jgi:protein SCO1
MHSNAQGLNAAASMTRRRCTGGLMASLVLAPLAWPTAVHAHDSMGPVNPPTLAPDLQITDHHGRARALRELLGDHITVLQTMFTGCSTVCPIQGALFARVQQRLAQINTRQVVQLLSISIDPLGDSPQALNAWLQRLQAPASAHPPAPVKTPTQPQPHSPPRWSAAVPKMADVTALQRGLDGATAPSAKPADDHSSRLYFFDAQARLRWRSSELPSVDEVMRVVNYLAP